MKKSEMQAKFQRLLEHSQEDLIRAKQSGDHSLTMLYYGQICGLAEAMRAVELVDWEQAAYIREQAMEFYKRDEDGEGHEAC